MANLSFWEMCLVLFLLLVVISALIRWAKQIIRFVAFLIQKALNNKVNI